jgi:L-fuconolactonase
MILDSHQHFWRYDSQRHSWITDDMAVIRRDFLPEDLHPLYTSNGIEGCIAVQAEQSEAENDFLIGLAKEHSFIKGVIGWVDLKSPTVRESLEKYAAFPIMKGVRHIVQGEPDPNFLLRTDFKNGIRQLADFDHTYDILVLPHQLGAVLEFVRAFPEQRFVLDHIGKPYIKDGFYDGWATLMKAIGSCENVSCKISGMVTEADFGNWTMEQLKPYVELVLESFGAERTMYGSDWPVCLVAADYDRVLQIAKTFAGALSKSEQELFWYKNAATFYKIQ